MENLMSLKGKVCVITGAGSGIGRETAILMAKKGAEVILVGRLIEKLDAVKSEVENIGGVAFTYPLDIANHEVVQTMAHQIIEKFKKIDILINCAGDNAYHRKLLTTNSNEISAVFNSNIFGTIYCTQAVVRVLDDPSQVTIINVSSLAATSPGMHAGMAYGTAKAAVSNFTKYLNREFRNTGFRASVIITGEVNTPMLEKRPYPPDEKARAAMITAEEVAEVITFIASMPQRVTIPEIVMRPTFMRDFKAEIEKP
jgi:NADP-dependent 3-hydroxy acid dehydrogenase YdfG